MDSQYVDTVVLNQTVWEALNGDAWRAVAEDGDACARRPGDPPPDTEPSESE